MHLLARSPRSPFSSHAAVRLALLALAIQAGLPAAARAYSDVVFFGDSLTDTGNTCAGVASAGGGFAPGRCSNGAVWADYFVEGLGFGSEATSSASGGSNYANGGSRTPDLAAQIDAYLAATGGTPDPDALHVVWLGGNDILFDVILPGVPAADMQEAAARIGVGIDALVAGGAQHFLVANAPDVGRVYGNPLLNPPFAEGSAAFDEADRAALSALSLEFNAALDEVLAGISGVSLLQIDVTASFDAIIDDPVAFGFSAGAVDATSQSRAFPVACLVDPVCAADPQGPVAEGFLIFDSVHPTTALHRLIADAALAGVVPEPSTALLLGVGLTTALGLTRRR